MSDFAQSPVRAEPASATIPMRAHARAHFEFVAKAPMDVVFPLLGADRERLWAPDWAPSFVWPAPAADREGMVFTVAHGPLQAIWVNTLFDPKGHRVQYVYVLPDHFVTRIAIELAPQGAATHVAVTYERTALSEAADAVVRRMSEHDERAGEPWRAQIDAYLDAHAAGPPDGASRP
jgi:hypothetical protein